MHVEARFGPPSPPPPPPDPKTEVEGVVTEYFHSNPSPWGAALDNVRVQMFEPGKTNPEAECLTNGNGYYKLEFTSSFSGNYIDVRLEFEKKGYSSFFEFDLYTGYEKKIETVKLWRYEKVTRNVALTRPIDTTETYTISPHVNWEDPEVAYWLENVLVDTSLINVFASQTSIFTKLYAVMDQIDYVLGEILKDGLPREALTAGTVIDGERFIPLEHFWTSVQVVRAWNAGYYPRSCGQRLSITLTALRWLSMAGYEGFPSLKGLLGVFGYDIHPDNTEKEEVSHFYVRGYYEDAGSTHHFSADAWVVGSYCENPSTPYPYHYIWSYGTDDPDYPASFEEEPGEFAGRWFYEFGIVSSPSFNGDFTFPLP